MSRFARPPARARVGDLLGLLMFIQGPSGHTEAKPVGYPQKDSLGGGMEL